MLATIIISVVIILYSSIALYKALKSKLKGNCDSCSGCSLNGACPVQQIKLESQIKEFHLNA